MVGIDEAGEVRTLGLDFRETWTWSSKSWGVFLRPQRGQICIFRDYSAVRRRESSSDESGFLITVKLPIAPSPLAPGISIGTLPKPLPQTPTYVGLTL